MCSNDNVLSPTIRPSPWAHSKPIKWSKYLGVNILTIQLTDGAIAGITTVTITGTTRWTCWVVDTVRTISICTSLFSFSTTSICSFHHCCCFSCCCSFSRRCCSSSRCCCSSSRCCCRCNCCSYDACSSCNCFQIRLLILSMHWLLVYCQTNITSKNINDTFIQPLPKWG